MLEAVAFVIGEALNHNLSVCLVKEDAIEIVNTDKEKGRTEAEKVWQEKDTCGTVPVIGHFVGKVVHSVQDKERALRVVEIRSAKDGAVIGYFMTRDEVNSAKGIRHIQEA